MLYIHVVNVQHFILQFPEPRFVSIPDVDKIFRSSTYLLRESHDLKEDYYFFLLKFKVRHLVM